MLEFPSPRAMRLLGSALLPLVAAVGAAQSRDVALTDSTAPTPLVATTLPAPSAPEAPPPAPGPTLAGATVAAHVTHDASRPAVAHTMAAKHTSQSGALMIVGGAAVVLGLLVGGDAETPLIIGGAVIGLIGLYTYLQ